MSLQDMDTCKLCDIQPLRSPHESATKQATLPTLFTHLKQEKAKYKDNFYLFLLQHPILRGDVHLLQHIFEFQYPPRYLRDEAECMYKCKMTLCNGKEHVWVEALHDQGGVQNKREEDMEGQEFCGSLQNRTFSGVAFGMELDDPWLGHAAYLTNPDGSFYSEGQLRRYLQDSRPHFCREKRGCNGQCLALQGDTVYWRYIEKPYRLSNGSWVTRQSLRYEPATDEDLQARGWPHGYLTTWCALFRQQANRRGFRFNVNTVVECRGENNQWCTGKIVQVLYREEGWRNVKEEFAPYKIQLDDGRFVYAPHDSNTVIKKVAQEYSNQEHPN